MKFKTESNAVSRRGAEAPRDFKTGIQPELKKRMDTDKFSLREAS